MARRSDGNVGDRSWPQMNRHQSQLCSMIVVPKSSVATVRIAPIVGGRTANFRVDRSSTPTARASAVNPPRRQDFVQENSPKSSIGCLQIVA
jgi:hypothetical protein